MAMAPPAPPPPPVERPPETFAPRLQKRTLKGHRGPVLCLDNSSSSRRRRPRRGSGGGEAGPRCLLLSGSEDGTARLWDLRSRKAALCVVVPRSDDGSRGEVTSVAFHPTVGGGGEVGASDDEEDGGRSFLPLNRDCTIFASAGNRVYGYDLRYHTETSSAPIVRTPHFDLSELFGCGDEINQLSFSHPRRNDASGNYWMAAADDGGEARVATCPPHRREGNEGRSPDASARKSAPKPKILRHAEPESMGITSASVFRPRCNDLYLATGGTDCTVKLWDADRPRRPASTMRIEPTEGEGATKLCNPPYVHSLSWSPSGRLLAAGAGDGAVVVMRAEGRRLVEIGRLGDDVGGGADGTEGGHGGHRSAVASVCFPDFGLCDSREELSARLLSKVRKGGEAEDRLLISAGNDGQIIFWDLGGNMVGDGPMDPAVYLDRCLAPDRKTTSDDAKSAADALGALELSGGRGEGECVKRDESEELAPSPPGILFRIAHRRKPNWITCSRASDAFLPTSLFVADTSNDISVYTLPS
ncbi:hypothetical protein ACHAWF_003625 [Thalassiosira exigua]